jgi:hypothetical protein
VLVSPDEERARNRKRHREAGHPRPPKGVGAGYRIGNPQAEADDREADSWSAVFSIPSPAALGTPKGTNPTEARAGGAQGIH